MNFHITFEGKESLAEIQRKFESHLSEKQILSATASAINNTSKRIQGFMRKEVGQLYTMNRKYLARMMSVRKFAQRSRDGLYSEIDFRYKPIPMVAFKHTGTRGKRGVISVEMRKGSTETFNHAFIARMSGMSKKGEHFEHEGIFAAGRYSSGKFVYEREKTASGKTRITELNSASPFTMSIGKEMEPKIVAYVNKNLAHTLRYMLQRKLDNMTKK